MEPEKANDGRLGEIVGDLETAGFGGQMAARAGGRIMCFTCHQESDAAVVEVTSLQRMEGASDPDDMLAVAALSCPNCGTKATLVLGYGPEADEDDAEVLVRLALDGRG